MVTDARDFLMVTCEHGGNRIPQQYAHYFRRWKPILATHRGFDAGALVMARAIAGAFDAPLVASTVSRLLVDLNRSLRNRSVWSDATRVLPPALHQQIAARYHTPYRTRVASIVDEAIAQGLRVLHVSSHSFTPVLEGCERTADVGLLYDPGRAGESSLAALWKEEFHRIAPSLRVRRNYPYAGKNDGLTASLRGRFSARRYVGIEIEMNQALVTGDARQWRQVRATVVATLRAAMHRA